MSALASTWLFLRHHLALPQATSIAPTPNLANSTTQGVNARPGKFKFSVSNQIFLGHEVDAHAIWVQCRQT